MRRIGVGLVTAGLFFADGARADDPPSAPSTAVPRLPPHPKTETSPRSPAGYNEPIATPVPGPDDMSISEHVPLAHDGYPLAAYHNGLFFIRDHHDNYHLYIQGRMQLDAYAYGARGVTYTSLKPTLFIRRVRPEISGELLGHWRFMIAGDFGATAIDNPQGRNETSAAPPQTAPTASNGRYAAAQTTRFQAAPTDAYINYRNGSTFNLQVGQMDAPFMMENRTSDKYIPFMERSLAVRAVGIPSNKEIGAMLWGETEDRVVYWSAGPYMGDGMNRPNVDSRFDWYGHAFVHPLARAALPQSAAIRDFQVGVSGHWGSRDHKWVNYDYASMTTQAAWAFWTPTYAGSAGTTHVIPAASQTAVAGELRIPTRSFDLTSELVYIHNDTREALEGFQATQSNRYGDIHGISYYVMAGWWPLGHRDIQGTPGYGNPPRLDYSKTDPIIAPTALQLLARWEQVSLAYRSASRAGKVDPKNMDGQVLVDAVSLGVNYWASRHVRISLDYLFYEFPNSGSTSTWTEKNRAQAPGNSLAAGVDDGARNNSHSMNELTARFAIAL